MIRTATLAISVLTTTGMSAVPAAAQSGFSGPVYGSPSFYAYYTPYAYRYQAPYAYQYQGYPYYAPRRVYWRSYGPYWRRPY